MLTNRTDGRFGTRSLVRLVSIHSQDMPSTVPMLLAPTLRVRQQA